MFKTSPINIKSYKDRQLLKRAVQERWPVSAETRLAILKHTEDIINDTKIEATTRLTAVHRIIQIDALNLKEQEIKVKAQPKHIIHTNMSTEDLMKSIGGLLAELNLTAEEADPQLLLEGEAKFIETKELEENAIRPEPSTPTT